MSTAKGYDMRVNKKVYWIGIIIVWILEVMLLLVGRDMTTEISVIRMTGLLIVYLILIMLRLKDAGKSGGLVLLCFIIPVFAIYAGILPSAEES